MLTDVTFELPRGKTFVRSGSQRAGKHDRHSHAAWPLPADAAGSMHVAGCDPVREPIELRRRVGYLAEDQAMYPWTTPVEPCRFLQLLYPTRGFDNWRTTTSDRFLELPRHFGNSSVRREGPVGEAGAGGGPGSSARRWRFSADDLGDNSIRSHGRNSIATRSSIRKGTDRTVIFSSHLLAEVENGGGRSSPFSDQRQKSFGHHRRPKSSAVEGETDATFDGVAANDDCRSLQNFSRRPTRG